MDKLNEFINILNSDKITALLYDFYSDNEDYINPYWRDEKKFVSYLKGYYLDRYLEIPDDLKSLLFSDLKDGELNVGVLETFLDKTNGSLAKPNDHMETGSLQEFKDLMQFKDDELYEELSNDNSWIMGLYIEKNGIITIDELKKGDYIKIDGYSLDNDEIKTIEHAKMVPGLINTIHSLYDDLEDERNKCNYDAIDDEVLKKFAFHTNKDNPEYNILFDDGTIVNYYKGDIRIMPINLMALVIFTKLTFIDNYYNGENNQLFQFMLEPYDIDVSDVPFSELDDETMEILMSIAIEMVYSNVESLNLIYSKKMIEDSKRDVKKMGELVKKYKL